MKEKILHKVARFCGGKKNGKNTFIEFGWVENPTFRNKIYIMICSAHKTGDRTHYLRIDEALQFIQGLAMALNKKVCNIDLERLF